MAAGVWWGWQDNEFWLQGCLFLMKGLGVESVGAMPKSLSPLRFTIEAVMSQVGVLLCWGWCAARLPLRGSSAFRKDFSEHLVVPRISVVSVYTWACQALSPLAGRLRINSGVTTYCSLAAWGPLQCMDKQNGGTCSRSCLLSRAVWWPELWEFPKLCG